MKRILLSVFCVLLLCGCTAQPGVRGALTTLPLPTTTEEYRTTDPTAKAVAGVEELSANKVVWGPGNIKDHQQPAEPAGLQEKYAKLNAEWLLEDKKSICLTFDEGYENGFTPAILDTLKEKQVQAIFFVTYDFARDNGELIRRMIDEGHIVGNHSWHHYSMDELDTKTAQKEVTYLHDYLLDTFGYHMEYFRFPKGEFSEKTLGILQQLGYKSVFWSYAYEDWDTQKQPDESTAFTGICESTHPGEIMLLHAVSGTNAAILGRVIDDIRQQGYRFTVKL